MRNYTVSPLKIPADPFLKVYGLLLLCVDLLSQNVYADVWRYVGVNPSLVPKASDRPSRLRRWRGNNKRKKTCQTQNKIANGLQRRKRLKELCFNKMTYYVKDPVYNLSDANQRELDWHWSLKSTEKPNYSLRFVKKR